MNCPLKPLGLALTLCSTQAANVKVAFIDPFSGPFAVLSQSAIHGFRTAEEVARAEGAKDTLEFVEFDNKLSPQESVNQLKLAIDQGYRYVMQAIGSGPTSALDALNKYNERNPDREVLLVNIVVSNEAAGSGGVIK